MSVRTARLDIRTTRAAKVMVEKAADFLGITVSAFILGCVVERASRILKQKKAQHTTFSDNHDVIYLNQHESKRFLDLVDHPPQPSPALKALFKKHQDAETKGHYVYGTRGKNRAARKRASS